MGSVVNNCCGESSITSK